MLIFIFFRRKLHYNYLDIFISDSYSRISPKPEAGYETTER